MTLQLVIFSVGFSHRRLRISGTTDHTKIIESHGFFFKVFVILRLYSKNINFKKYSMTQQKFSVIWISVWKEIFLIIKFKHDQLFHGLTSLFVKNSKKKVPGFIVIFFLKPFVIVKHTYLHTHNGTH